jgi:hypothetical protein
MKHAEVLKSKSIRARQKTGRQYWCLGVALGKEKNGDDTRSVSGYIHFPKNFLEKWEPMHTGDSFLIS